MNSQKIIRNRYSKEKSVMVNKDLKFDASIKDNIKMNYQDVGRSVTLENEIYEAVDLEGKTSPHEYTYVHKCPIRPESVNRINNQRRKSNSMTPSKRVIKRS